MAGDPVLLDVGLNWSGLDSQLDQLGAKIKSAIASISAPAPANSIFDESKIAKMGDAFEKAASRKEVSAEKAAQAAERQAEREAAASAKAAAEVVRNAERAEAAKIKAAQAAEAALDKAVDAELRAAEKEIAAQNRAAANAEKAAAQQQRAAERLAASLEKTVVAGDRAEAELRKLAAVTPGQKAAVDFDALSARVKKLGEESGNTSMSSKILAAEQQRLAVSLGQQAKSADIAAGGYNRAGAGAQNLFHQLKDAAAGLASGQDPMQILAQQGPQVADAFEMGGGAAATMGSALSTLMGPVGLLLLGIAPLVLAWYEFSSALEEAEAKAKGAEEALKSLQKAAEPYAKQQYELALNIKVANGEITKGEAASIRAHDAYMQSAEALIAERNAAIQAAAAKVHLYEAGVRERTGSERAAELTLAQSTEYHNLKTTLEQNIAVRDTMRAKIEQEADTAGLLAEKLAEEGGARKERTHNMKDEEQRLKEMAAAYLKLDEVQAKATRSANQLDWGLKEGAKTATEAKDAYDAEIQLIERQSEVLLKAAKNPAEIAKINAEVLQAQQAAMAEYNAQSHAIMQANLDAITYSGAEGVLKAKKQWEQRLNDLKILQASGVLSERDAAQQKLEITADYERQLETIYQTAYQKLDKQRQEDLKKEQEAARKKREMAYGYVGMVGETLGMIDGLLDQSNAKQKAAHKALAISQILISGAIAVAKGFEQYGWPAGLIPAALTTVQTGLQIAAVEKAHQGRVLIRHQGGGVDYPDELRILRSEMGGILNSQATRRLGEQGVAAINGGASPTSITRLKIGRVESNEITRLDVLSNGPISDKMRRQRASTALDTGFRGKMAPA